MQPASGVACPLCGAAHAACGQATSATPVDVPMRKGAGVGPVRKYKVNHNGYETVLKLNDEDVKAYPDAQLVDDTIVEQAPEPEPEPDGAKPAEKSRTAANKARRPTGDK